MGQTANLRLPYPELADTPNVPRDVKALADAIDTQVHQRDTFRVTATLAANTPYTVTHNFGVDGVNVTVYSSGEEVSAVVRLVTVNSLTVTVSLAGSYRIVVQS